MSDAKNISFGQNPYDFSAKGTHELIRLSGELSADVARNFEKKVASDLGKIESNVIIDMTAAAELHPNWTRPLLAIANHVKAKKKQIRVVGANPGIQKWFQNQGIAAALPCVSAMADALRHLEGPNLQGVDPRFVQAFTAATKEIIEAQTQKKVAAEAPSVRDSVNVVVAALSGTISIKGDKVHGFFSICFPAPTYLAIISTMLGESFPALTPELSDGAAELTNMIFGHAKVSLNAEGYGIQMALPNILSGPNHVPPALAAVPKVSVPFTSDFGPFSLEISVWA